jgi:hypothetical protein
LPKTKLRPKTISDVTFKNEYEALAVLDQLIGKIIDEDFKGNADVKMYVKRRIEGAREVLRRGARDFFTSQELRSEVPSAEAMKKGLPKEVRVRTLDGEEKVVRVGASYEEAFYAVRVSRYRFKCNCQDAIMLSSAADRRFKSALLRNGIKKFPTAEPIFYKYVLCKHTLAKIAEAMANPSEGVGIFNVDKAFVDTLKIALYAVYLRTSSDVDPEITEKIVRIIRRRIGR